MDKKLDITIACSSFPVFTSYQIQRQNLIETLHDTFSPLKNTIVINGLDGSGKTTFLAQFAKYYCDRCFCYFVRKDIWSSDPVRFLTDLCEQMSIALGNKLDEKTIPLDFYQLKPYFNKLYTTIAKKGRQGNDPYFIIVDGLEWISKTYGLDSILDYLPCDPLPGVYFLGSSDNKQILDFNHESKLFEFFGPAETSTYLKLIGINDEEIINRIYQACKGMPGYLDQLRREISSGININGIVENLPTGFINLLEREWNVFKKSTPSIINALSIITFSITPVSPEYLSEIVNIPIKEIKTYFAKFSTLNESSNGSFEFVTDAHKKFYSEKLLDKKSWVEGVLIQYLEDHKDKYDSQVQLPLLYLSTGKYQALKKIINTENLIANFQDKKELSSLRNLLKIACNAAINEKDWQGLSTYTLFASAIKTIELNSPLEIQVDAYLSLGKIEEAVGIAYQAILPEDQLELLSKVCNKIRKNEIKIPEDVTLEIYRLIKNIIPNEATSDRLIEIAANLFYVDHQAAIRLVEKISAIDNKDHAIELVLAALSLRLDDDNKRTTNQIDYFEDIRSRISNKELREFIRVNSPLLSHYSPTELFREIEIMSDMSAKVYMIRSWCNANRNSQEAPQVVEYGLDLMTSNMFTPSMRHLRQLAEPICINIGNDPKTIIEKLDILKETALKNPIEEYVRLELVLASIESKIVNSSGYERLLNLITSISYNEELDTECYCIIRILLSLSEINPNDPCSIKEEYESKLPGLFKNLLGNSANHIEVVRKILRILTIYNPKEALKLADSINNMNARDNAYFEILKIYTRNDYTNISIDFIDELMNKIVDDDKRERIIITILSNFSEHHICRELPKAKSIFAYIPKMKNHSLRCIAYAHSVSQLSNANDSKSANKTFDLLINIWNSIESLNSQISTGYDCVTILAKNEAEKAQRLLTLTRKKHEHVGLSDERISSIYINTLRLTIRAYSDILKDKEYLIYRGKLIEAIERVPSIQVKSLLIGDLALRHLIAEKEKDFNEIMDQYVISLLENLENKEEEYLRSAIVIGLAPCLYEYDRSYFTEEINHLGIFDRNVALQRVFQYLISGRSISDPVDLDCISESTSITYIKANQICELISWMTIDSIIYGCLESLINIIIMPPKNNVDSEKCTLPEKQAISIGKKIYEITDKFPDMKNIQHEGYKVVSQALLARLRSSSQERAKQQWDDFVPSWKDIASAAKNIPNIADRVLVLVWVAKAMGKYEPKLAQELVNLASEGVKSIPTLIERCDRFQIVATAWKGISDDNSAKFFLNQAMNSLSSLEWTQTRDHITGSILELAHEISPEYAASLTSTVDNPFIKQGLNQFLTIQDLKINPLQDIKPCNTVEDICYIRGRASSMLLKSLCSGKKQAILSEEKLIPWVIDAFNASYKDAFLINSWVIENQLILNKGIHTSLLHPYFEGLLDNLFGISIIGQILEGNNHFSKDINMSNPNIPESLQLFKVGSKEDAEVAIKKRVESNVTEYLKIYDGYYSPKNIMLLGLVPENIRIYILCLRRNFTGINDENIIEAFKSEYVNAFPVKKPELHVDMFGIKDTGDGPIHDRYYITRNGKGLQIGTSISGLGNKDSSIRSMSKDEVNSIESEFVDKMILNPPFLYKNEKLNLFRFTVP